ncbi:MAG TPA: flagellar basal body-associated FliL family protein [Micropepsaceae bacterium]|nr:flagellar basal body-associated FliL family protein [Micropepsaceae bacterium]
MAKKEKAAAPSKEDGEAREGDAESAAPAKKKSGLVGRILGPVMMIVGFVNPLKILKLPLKLQLMVVGALLLVLGGGAAYHFLAPTPQTADEAALASVKTEAANLPPATAAFFDIPDIIVNIQTPDSAPAYLKLSVSLELDKAEAKLSIEPVLPRIIDQFQTYLRELRVEDIRGSAGVMRLKEELLRRVNLAVAPTTVHDVLLKEMIIQ